MRLKLPLFLFSKSSRAASFLMRVSRSFCMEQIAGANFGFQVYDVQTLLLDPST